MKKILISLSVLLSLSAFAQAKDADQSNDMAQSNNAVEQTHNSVQEDVSSVKNDINQLEESHKKNPLMIQLFWGAGATDGGSPDYSTEDYAFKMLYSPFKFSFANLILGSGIEQEYLKNYYGDNSYSNLYSWKSRITTTYILLDAGLEFNPRSNIKIIPVIEYGYGALSNRYYTTRNNADDTETETKEKVTTQKVGVSTEGLLSVTENFYMGVDIFYYSQFVNTDKFSNSGLSLIASYSL